MAEITIKDVARRCGVGVSTVSRAINNHPDINPETKKMIMDVIQDSGYIPNNSARNLKRSDAKSIAVLIKGITNPFFSSMIQIIEEETQQKGYSMELRHVEAYEDEVDVALELVKEKRLRGIVFLGGYFSHSEEKLGMLKVPFVFGTVGATPENINKALYSNVAVDDFKESKRMTEYLIGLGHKEIAILTAEPGDISIGKLRLEGYKAALTEHGIPVRENLIRKMEEGMESYSMENGYQKTKELIESGESFTAIYGTADSLAIGAMRALLDAGIRIPEEVSVAGYDGIELGDYYAPRLTTIRQPVEEMAREMTGLLFHIISGKEEHKHLVFPGELLVKESTAEPKIKKRRS
ncbi:MAG: LacI family transcriptional regulator [Lachnospiraceae bacterium]|nr:LacI family transcriptional regulator [Lachnospiraceae bacterium]